MTLHDKGVEFCDELFDQKTISFLGLSPIQVKYLRSFTQQKIRRLLIDHTRPVELRLEQIKEKIENALTTPISKPDLLFIERSQTESVEGDTPYDRTIAQISKNSDRLNKG